MALGRRKGSFLRPQGLLAPQILVTKAEQRARDVDTLPDAVIRFCTWCVEEAGLVREEVQPDAWRIFHSSNYVAEVRNGGHGQFAGNSAMRPEILDDVEAGLETLGLADLLAIFRRFRGALDRDSELKRAAMEGYGFGDIPAAIREVDDAFFKSPDPDRFHREASRWLREAPTVAVLTPREMRVRQAAIVAANRLLERRRAAAERRPLRERLTGLALRLWDRTGLRRPGETVLDHVRRRVAATPTWGQAVSAALGELVPPFYPAVQDGDHEEVEAILAAYRDIHERFRIETTSRWPGDIRFYAHRLQYAGERLGRADLLELAADAWGRALAAGPPSHDYDPGAPWRSLGETLVELGRLDQRHMPAVAEALDAFEQAAAIDRERDDSGYWAKDLMGRAEAHLVLAALGSAEEHLRAAGEALEEARPLLRPWNRDQWRAIDAELLTLLPPGRIRARDRARALKGLDRAIAWELEEEGSPKANPRRLERLYRLRGALAASAEPG